jgi:hypothetical protein
MDFLRFRISHAAELIESKHSSVKELLGKSCREKNQESIADNTEVGGALGSLPLQ